MTHTPTAEDRDALAEVLLDAHVDGALIDGFEAALPLADAIHAAGWQPPASEADACTAAGPFKCRACPTAGTDEPCSEEEKP
ncbi:MAG: hypothetical protein K0S49_38 [Microbacterium sp.]|jgi:hypothetical protein|nr:hypothetical protein [Microbacterium sp.]